LAARSRGMQPRGRPKPSPSKSPAAEARAEAVSPGLGRSGLPGGPGRARCPPGRRELAPHPVADDDDAAEEVASLQPLVEGDAGGEVLGAVAVEVAGRPGAEPEEGHPRRPGTGELLVVELWAPRRRRRQRNWRRRAGWRQGAPKPPRRAESGARGFRCEFSCPGYAPSPAPALTPARSRPALRAPRSPALPSSESRSRRRRATVEQIS